MLSRFFLKKAIIESNNEDILADEDALRFFVNGKIEIKVDKIENNVNDWDGPSVTFEVKMKSAHDGIDICTVVTQKLHSGQDVTLGGVLVARQVVG